MSRLLVLGGSGRLGQHILEQASQRGVRVRALVRNPDVIPALPGVELVPGTPANIDDIRAAAEGTDAVVVALNNAHASDNPWAKPVSPPSFMTDAVRDTLTVMADHGLRRIVITSALGVGDSWRVVNPIFKTLVNVSSIKNGYDDHNGVERLVRDSDVDWTLVRATALTNKPPAGPLHAAEAGQDKHGPTVSRSEVARFLLDTVENNAWIRRAPLIWNSRR